jgi:hypothetical protein
MVRDLLIDGYNLMYAAGFVRATYGPGDLHRCRMQLLNFLAGHLDEAQRRRTTVVFDAKDPPPDADRWGAFQQIHIEFAPPGMDADDVIEEQIAAHSAPKHLLVVSSDHRLHKAARRRRAKVKDSDKFLDACEAAARRIDDAAPPPPEKPPDGLSPQELALWAAEFGAVDIAALRKELQQPRPQAPAAPPAPSEPPREGDPVPQEPPSRANADEVAFWEQRLSDLLGDSAEAP